MRLAQFLEDYRDAISDAVARAYPPRYDAETRRTCGFDLGWLRRRPLGAQADAIRAAALSIREQRGTIVVGEMGSGKSFIAAAAAFLAGCRRIFVVAPPHLTRKWVREIRATVPEVQVNIIRTIADLERERAAVGPVRFVVCSRELAKLGYRWRPATIARIIREPGGGVARDATGAILRAACCPVCFAPILDDEGVPLERDELARKKRRCAACGGPLWQADRAGPRRVPLADYLLRRMRGHFDLLIADEVHELKARGSAQGLAGAALAEACDRSLILTGTLLGGYASSLFHVLYRFSPAIRAEFAHADEARWVARYGYLARITKRDPDARADDGRRSKRRTYPTRVVEKPGVTPPILFHLIGNTVFLRLRDVAAHLPPYDERVQLVPLDAANEPGEPSQAESYRRLATDLRLAIRGALHAGSKRLLGAYLQALLAWPDACTRAETILDPRSGELLAHAPALSGDRLFPKELALIALARRARERGRRTLVYATHTGVRDLTPRLRAVLDGAGLRVAVLKADTISPERREEWVTARVREGVDVLVTNPRLVQTGLDLVDFASVAWMEVDYSVYVLRQASRRSWRLGQTQPVEVTYLAYEGTLQADALGLVAAKTRASLMVEGELPEEGLAALGGDGGDVYLALARRFADGDDEAAGQRRSLEALFGEARRGEEEADELLVDRVWDEEPGTARERTSAPLVAVLGEVAQLADLPLFAMPVVAKVPEGGDRVQGTVVTLEDLARLVRRPKPRRRPVPAGQLMLFGS